LAMYVLYVWRYGGGPADDAARGLAGCCSYARPGG
jgi:hypothetical protein